VEIDGRGGGDDFAAAHGLKALEFMQGAMETVDEGAFVTPQVGEDDEGGFEDAARIEDRIAHIEVGFLVFDIAEGLLGLDAIIGAHRNPRYRGEHRGGFNRAGFVNGFLRFLDCLIMAGTAMDGGFEYRDAA
jgi:hypothetical protein